MNTALYYGAKLVVFVTPFPLMIVSPGLTTKLMSRAEHAIEHRLQMSNGRPWRDGGAAHRASHEPPRTYTPPPAITGEGWQKK